MKHHSFKTFFLIPPFWRETVLGGQFKWGTCLLKCNGGVYKVSYSAMETRKVAQRHKLALLQDG